MLRNALRNSPIKIHKMKTTRFHKQMASLTKSMMMFFVLICLQK